jgi:hypothetical protein
VLGSAKQDTRVASAIAFNRAFTYHLSFLAGISLLPLDSNSPF